MPAKTRDPWLDNAKIMLVTIVVVGHAIVLVPEGPLVSRTYDWIYYFHMPAFIVITGYLSRGVGWTRRHLTQVVTMLLVPYVLFEGLMAWFRVSVGGEDPLQNLWLDPHWPMWYLVVLAMWRLATPVLKLHWVAVPASIVISLAAGSISVPWLDINRALGFLPFFVVGLHLTPAALRWFRSRGAWMVGLTILAAFWWLAGLTDDWIGTQWLYYRDAYADLQTDVTHGLLMRGVLMSLSFLGAVAILTLVPHGKSWFSAMGKYTMVVYLFHGFIVRGAAYAGYSSLLPEHPAVLIVVTSVLAVLVSLLLASPPVGRVLIWAVDPINSALQRRRQAPETEPVRAG